MAKQVVERSFEFRAAEDGDGLTLSGYAAVFDTPTRIDSWEGQFDEVIARGAFKKSIDSMTPIMQWNHGNDPAFGQIPIGAISTLREDARGLFVEARLHDNEHTKPVRDAIASGAISGMSFKFRVVREEEDTSGDVPVRTVREVQLFELGPVAHPAYPTTSVGVRSEERDVVVVVAGETESEDGGCCCPSCGAEVDPNANFCTDCGAQISDAPCAACGQLNKPDAKFCSSCGSVMPSQNSATLPRAALRGAPVGNAGLAARQPSRSSMDQLKLILALKENQ